MEEVQTEAQETQVTPPQSTSFSVEPREKNNGSKWILIFIGLLILGGAGIFFFTRSRNEAIATPTPSFNTTPIDETETATSTPVSSPSPVKKSEVSIEIQNGTGIPGEAAYLQTQLKALGYSDITAGNANSTDNTITTVTFSKTLFQTVQDEIKKELEKIYKEVSVKTSTTQKSDVVIVTGLRSSQTTKPGSSGTPKPSATAVSSASPSATPTPTGI
ncbi:MAG: hypothetical protein UR39_C0001G0025 [Candidatus Woesebacteria bacterium GW2011_GWA1_33_30]|uniref:LytR/CpsA/Psr regulator C-terminal domain-containing protein n=1 Tax=Candidatus Woesebacteria bacterium GW2011_GWA2_33_28 TaxID=1618561 RepID=A0A0G0CAM4_9BACT|nr:MAG: hypothetical protein UR38_C0001G0026 [Candidatus Woesebacteria bacterium GW2011_GWA2_33_28]KKP48992.1 MAG: hypothetical protein UR39_C0001G0025 [Candidatus Woesebacteria bacterium GW2011_GWA1_33_30]KKP49900.1 MAG: hypothetical protein UR40_C0003G0072 [Microgenomates group bacterium GW2011_GWC1_33_32]KKP52584.1 MAG: hypothetical protein UR44_C0001G0026 [Candidatus Woesebacteria bacterium GW2011_GWB1_33_38]KKP55768.1 MAG: hypothetical protein UR48_C0051G0002 [Microgenomates group bacteriu